MNSVRANQSAYSGLCACCGLHSRFESNHYSFREGYACSHCGASTRYRAQADAIVRCFGRTGADSLKQLVLESTFQECRIYEPGVAGPFRKHFRGLAKYQQSFFWPDVAPGNERDGVRCENLEQLTFNDECFELVISSDIFEHVRKPMLAFEEIHRVLCRGGAHVFTIPVEHPMQNHTVQRVDVSGNEDVHLLTEHYHGDGAGGRSLVYNDFGADLINQLNAMGFLCELERPRPLSPVADKTLTFICWKP